MRGKERSFCATANKLFQNLKHVFRALFFGDVTFCAFIRSELEDLSANLQKQTIHAVILAPL